MVLTFPLLTIICGWVKLLSDSIMDMMSTPLGLMMWYHGRKIYGHKDKQENQERSTAEMKIQMR